jgi:thioredoxin reductase (NADPH)
VVSSIIETRRPQVFPRLTDAQIKRLEAFGQHMPIRAGELLVQPGDRSGRLMVVLSGSLEVVRPGLLGDEPVTVQGPGEFTGELSSLRGIGGFVRTRVREDGEVLVIDHANLRRLVQVDSEISEIFMRAFILRRMALVASPGAVIMIGSRHSAGTLRLRQFLSRNAFPYAYYDVETDADTQELIARFGVSVDEVPIVVCVGGQVLRNPSNTQVAECLGMNPQIDDARVRDVVVIGAGPAGLSAAVYAASEGLDVLVIESTAPGGQAGSSSRIENYLGFPTGISGQALAGRALVQAQKFGADVAIARSALRLNCEHRPYRVEISGEHVVLAQTIIIATGAQYRQLELDNVARLLGNGIYYAATALEAKLCGGEEVIIVGGGNSAGQAAVYLSSSCRRVRLMVRSDGLSESMSRYLIRRIEDSPNITLSTRTELSKLEGDAWLERVSWRNTVSGAVETGDIKHVFLMTGAVPNTRWLAGCIAMDQKGFVRTGPELTADELARRLPMTPRPPFLFETSLPGIFAVGDVRAGSVKRVASAVGEGSICVQFIHQTLHD